ncbi:hypothetical protein F5883DRAFT_522389 [Diaporthe sp. PMI_573]|nr:hypothetical protein F5883DRAFT_522389 [Diaporthaceae sp. PMI_573]
MDPDKRKRNPRKSITAEEAFASILQAGRDLRIRGGLTAGKQNMAREAAVVLNTPQSTRARQGYRVFLYDIYEKCGPHGVLLCAIQLGQHRSMTMRKRTREDFVSVMELNKENAIIKCPEIESCAREYGMYPSRGYRECRDTSGESSDDHGGAIQEGYILYI